MKYYFLFICTLLCSIAFPQPKKYTAANIHSHNDYEQLHPFWDAYNAGAGSIEADIFLVNDKLIVAHDSIELKQQRHLEDYYLKPVEACLAKNNGYIYADTAKKLQLLIDVKTDSLATLDALIKLLQQHPTLTTNKTITWVISGNRPPDAAFINYPSFIQFDGIAGKTYNKEALTKIAMLSNTFKNYSLWNGEGAMPDSAIQRLKIIIENAHALQKPVRFWAAPDNANTWRQLMTLVVDFINTDHIAALQNFMKQQ